MFPLRPTRAAAAAFTACLAVLAAFAPTARADVKVQTLTTVTGAENYGAKGLPVTNTYYIKGDKFRVDDNVTNVTFIYDAAADKYYTLDHQKKTYSVQTYADMRENANAYLGEIKVVGGGRITDSGTPGTVAGQKARDYQIELKAALVVSVNKRDLAVAKVEILGDQWATDAIQVSPKIEKAVKEEIWNVNSPFGKLFDPLITKVDSIKGIPIQGDLTLTVTGGSANGLEDVILEQHVTAKGINTSPIKDSVFAVPSGYKLVPPVPPTPIRRTTI